MHATCKRREEKENLTFYLKPFEIQTWNSLGGLRKSTTEEVYDFPTRLRWEDERSSAADF